MKNKKLTIGMSIGILIVGIVVVTGIALSKESNENSTMNNQKQDSILTENPTSSLADDTIMNDNTITAETEIEVGEAIYAEPEDNNRYSIDVNSGTYEDYPTEAPIQSSAIDYMKNANDHVRTCTKCGVKETASHNGDWVITKFPTCNATGSRKKTCPDCKYTQTATIDKDSSAHDWSPAWFHIRN